MNLLKLTLLLGLSVCAVQPSMAMDDSDEFLGNQQATETFLATLKNLVQYGDTTRDNYDILALLTAEEMSNRIRHLFDPKRGPTEEELEWILRGMYKVMRDFKGNFLFENYFLNYPHFVEQDPKFKEHCRLLYAIALYFSDGYIRDNIAGRGSYLTTAEHLSRNYPEIRGIDKKYFENFIKKIDDVTKKSGLVTIKASGEEDKRVFPVDILDEKTVIDDKHETLTFQNKVLWVNFDGEDKISTIETYKRQNDPHPLVNGEGSVGIVYVSPTADPLKAQSFLLNKYKDYISYYFSFFDNGNFHLLGYIHPNAQVIVPSSDTGGKSSFGKLLVLSSAPLSQDAQYKIENLENYLDTCRGYLYPIDLLIQEDEKTNIHDLSDEFFRQLVSNQNLVGAAPLILEGTIPPGYNNTYFDQMGVMDLNKIGTGEAFTKLSDANFETLFPIVKVLKDEVLRAKEALIKDQSNGQLKWDVTQAEKELKEFRESTALKDDIQSVLGKNTNVPYIPLIVKEEKKYIPNSPTRDWEWDMKFDLGQEKTAKISYLTSAAALRNFVDTRSDGDFFANNEYYMIEKSDLMYKNYGDSFGQKFNDLPDVLYSHFYVDKILFRYDKRTKTLHKESDGLMALSESGIQLPMLVGCIEKKYGLGEGTVKVAALDPSLGYKKSTVAIDTSAMEYKNYVAPKTLSQHSSQQGAKIQGIGAKAFKKAQKLVKPGEVKKIDKS